MCGNKRQVLRMAMCEMYPATWQEFIGEKYFRDHKEIYTNGSEIMLVSDVKKMMQHYSQERPKGRWIDTSVENSTGNIYQCSNCGGLHNPNKKDVELNRVKEKPDYCSNCGADMRESE